MAILTIKATLGSFTLLQNEDIEISKTCLRNLIKKFEETCSVEDRPGYSRGKAHCNVWELKLVSLYYLNLSIFVFQIEDFLNNKVQHLSR